MSLHMSLISDIEACAKNKCILVVGDFFLDKYIYTRDVDVGVSLYSGGPAYMIEKTITSPGAAGTVAKNLSNLGIGSIYAVGFRGDDGDGFTLEKDLHRLGIDTDNLFVSKNIDTPCYTMIMRDSGSGFVEYGEASVQNLHKTVLEDETKLISAINDLVESKHPDAIVFLDQLDLEDCGVITRKVRRHISYLTNRYPEMLIYIDSRKHISDVNEKAIRKCNEYEFMKAYSIEERLLPAVCVGLSQNTSAPVIVTLGKNGTIAGVNGAMLLSSSCPLTGKVDTRGAGDAFTSGYISAKLANVSEEQSLFFGNVVASCCVSQVATTGTVTMDTVRSALEKESSYKER